MSTDLPATKKPPIVGIILAGGTAERLGLVVKANLRVGGKTLLQRTKNRINSHCDHLILSTGTHKRALFEDAGDLVCVGDNARGPARALIKGAAYVEEHIADAELLVSVAVDAPFLPADFVSRAKTLLSQDVDAVVGAFAGQTYPTNTLWRLAVFLRMRQASNKQRTPRSLFGLLEQANWVKLDYAALCTCNPFENVNTPAELVGCNRRALSELA